MTRTDSLITGTIKAIEYTRHMVDGTNTMPNNNTERAWEQRFYKTLHRYGLTKSACGASSHGLRHAYAQERYAQNISPASHTHCTMISYSPTTWNRSRSPRDGTNHSRLPVQMLRLFMAEKYLVGRSFMLTRI